MRITVNGRESVVERSLSITELLAEFGLAPLRVAVELNEQLIKRAAFDATWLSEGDQIEIVTLVGGG